MMVYGGISFAHLREMALAALKVVALLSPGKVFPRDPGFEFWPEMGILRRSAALIRPPLLY